MSRPARHGPTTVYRFRFRQDDQARLDRIKIATASKTDSEAIRYALIVADARLNGKATVRSHKESGPASSGSTSYAGSRQTTTAPVPQARVCEACGLPMARHQLTGACPA